MDDLDDILDSALDELDEGEEEEGGGDDKNRSSMSKEATSADGGEGREGAGAVMDPTGAEARGARGHNAGESTGVHGQKQAEGGDDKLGPCAAAEPSAEEKELQDTIAKTIEMLGRVDGGSLGGEGADSALLDEAFLNELASEFERLGHQMGEGNGGTGGPNEDRMVDDMVKQLLCKELMYPPLKQVTDAFPAWLERPESRRNEQEYNRYKEQYELFRQIVRVYETDEGNMNLLLDLMTKAQEYGQPPKEILEELMPGGVGASGMMVPPGLEDGEPCCMM